MTAQSGFRQAPAASFRRVDTNFRRFAASSSVVSAGIGVAKSLTEESFGLAGFENIATSAAVKVLDTAKAATALLGDAVDIVDAVRDSQGAGWASRTAAGAAASQSLLTDLGTVAGSASIVTTALGIAPALPLIAAGLTVAGAGATLWKSQQDRKGKLSTQNGDNVGQETLGVGDSGGGGSGTGGGVGGAAAIGTAPGLTSATGSMLKQLRLQIAQLDRQLDQLGTNLNQQQEQLRRRGERLTELIGGSATERVALNRLAESINALRRSRSAVSEAKSAIGKLQL